MKRNITYGLKLLMQAMLVTFIQFKIGKTI